jgi:predicted  nucleic acid-binding Zn-ribbon protein
MTDWQSKYEELSAQHDEFVEDSKAIEAELEAQLASTKKQFEALCTKYDKLKLSADSSHKESAQTIHSLEAKNIQQEREFCQLRDQYSNLNQRWRSLENSKDNLENKLRITENYNQDLQAQLDEAQELHIIARSDLEESISLHNEKLGALQEHIKLLEASNKIEIIPENGAAWQSGHEKIEKTTPDKALSSKRGSLIGSANLQDQIIALKAQMAQYQRDNANLSSTTKDFSEKINNFSSRRASLAVLSTSNSALNLRGHSAVSVVEQNNTNNNICSNGNSSRKNSTLLLPSNFPVSRSSLIERAKPYDLAIFGFSSKDGRLLRALMELIQSPSSVNCAVAVHNQAESDFLRNNFSRNSKLSVHIVDLKRPLAIESLVNKSKQALFLPSDNYPAAITELSREYLISACARAGTNYLDSSNSFTAKLQQEYSSKYNDLAVLHGVIISDWNRNMLSNKKPAKSSGDTARLPLLAGTESLGPDYLSSEMQIFLSALLAQQLNGSVAKISKKSTENGESEATGSRNSWLATLFCCSGSDDQ